MKNKDAYEKKLRAQLDEWTAEIARLKAKSDQAEANAQLEFYKQVDELRLRKLKVEERLKDLQRASDDAWEELKGGIDDACKDLESAFRKAAARFR